ncbi:MAG TPA: oligosaccharide repeat unit polymerase [Cerasibacillus sp.]|uniref:oligosaccharide repeat unit polymerase n=1 Tax=Cerasibacillus sp. TaxID=2498711 RepID=UPI002F40AAC7
MKTTIKQMAERMNRIDTFSPYFFLPFILMLYFFVSLFDFHRFELFNVTVSIWPAVFVALASYYVTVYFVDKKGWTFPTFGLSFLRGYTMWAIYLLGLIGLVAYISMIAGGEVGITDESIRRNLDPKLNFLSQLLWFSTMLIISLKIIQDENMSKGKLLMYGALYGGLMFLYLLMGYRTPIIVMLFTGLIIFHYVVKEIKLTWFLTTLLIIGIFFSLFGFFRVISEDTSLDFNSREQPDVELTKEKEKELITVEQKVNSVPKWIRSLNGEAVTGHIVLSKIIEYTQEEGYLNGEIHAGIFATLLPGEQTSPRMKVTEVVNSLSVEEGKYITRPTRTTTPTYIGQLFLDGGYLLVALGFAFYGFIIALLYNQVKNAGIRSYQSVAFAFVLTIFTVTMHTGLLDLIFVLMIGFVILTASINQAPKKKTL